MPASSMFVLVLYCYSRTYGKERIAWKTDTNIFLLSIRFLTHCKPPPQDSYKSYIQIIMHRYRSHFVHIYHHPT